MKKMKNKILVRTMLAGLLMLSLCGIFGISSKAASTGTYSPAKAYQVVTIVNKERKKRGLAPLKADKELMKAAMLRAKECAKFFSHTRPDGTLCFTACEKMHGENIFGGYSSSGVLSAQTAMTGWMNSPGHKANILTGEFQSIGVGCYTKGKYTYYTQAFSYDPAEDTTKLGTSKVSIKKLTRKARGFKVTYKKAAGVSGYQISYSTRKSSGYKTITTKSLGKTIKKLQKNRTYYVKVRAYQSFQGGRIYGTYSKVKTVRTK